MVALGFWQAAVLAVWCITSASPYDLNLRSAPALPSEDLFYAFTEADIDSVEPGTILRHRMPPAPIASFNSDPMNLDAAYQILYRTTDNVGNATATVVTVLIPHNANMSKILSYQAAEDAASINCAPSYAFQLKASSGPDDGTIPTQAALLLIEACLEQGWVVIAPDHLGPKAAFLANALSGHATLDGIRAVLGSSSFTGIAQNPSIAMWGYSGGSLATNWAAELQPTYAPELHIAGAAVGGTVPNITNVIEAVNNGYAAGLIPSGIIGLTTQYAELDKVISEHLKPQFEQQFYKPLNQCLVANLIDYANEDILDMFDDHDLLYTNPAAVQIVRENALGKATPSIPLYVYKAVPDEVSPVDDTDELVKRYCDAGATVEYLRDLVSSHVSLAVTGAPGALSWLIEALDGSPRMPGCSTKTEAISLPDQNTPDVIPKAILDALLDLLGKPVGPLSG